MLGISIRKTAKVVKVNKNTVERYFKKFAEAIVNCVEDESDRISGEVEVDESYFGGIRKGRRHDVVDVVDVVIDKDVKITTNMVVELVVK